ncbi:DUF924 family protein [Nocardioides sp.]|uniref:DUF924 family protein n=1 Tax=Nocardioides sp. TaxID=35761 RepID=UPI002627B9E7|nr:DUF924 family protein [Nocardioides sp.]
MDPESLLDVWFADAGKGAEAIAARSRLWFSRDEAFDALLRERFHALPDRARDGELAAWRVAPRSALALVIALDQLPRNLFRDSARAFAYDDAALEVALDALERGFDARLHSVEATFLYLPLEHAEDRALQARCVALFRALRDRAAPEVAEHFDRFLSFAERHHAVVERFGRFPHRNRVLGRRSTPEEERYLASGGDTFGG